MLNRHPWAHLESSFQALITGHWQPELRNEREYSLAWQQVSTALSATGARILSRRGIRNPCLAGEDVTQQWFVVMHGGGFNNCDKALPFFPFGYVVFLGRCSNYSRTARRKRISFLGSWDLESRQTNCPATALEISDSVRRALDCLPVHFRNAMTAQHLDGLSVAEAAEKYGTSPGTMRVWRCRGRAMLRVLLRDLDPWCRD
jgi:RNA polymerase sigma factor (sigma-70 family)